MNLLSLVSFFNFTGFTCCLIYISRSGVKNSVAKAAILANLIMAICTFAYTFFYSADNEVAAWFWYKIGIIGWFSLPSFSAYYYFQISHSISKVKKIWRHLIFCIFPIILISINLICPYTSAAFDLVKSSSGLGWTYFNSFHSPLLWIYIVYILIYFGISFFLVYRWGKHEKINNLKRQANILVFLYSVILVLGLFTDVFLPLFSGMIPPVAALFLVVVLYGEWLIIVKYSFFAVPDQSKSQLIFETIMDAVVLVDPQGSIIKVNQAATELLGGTAKELSNQSIRSFFVNQPLLINSFHSLMEERYIKNMETEIKAFNGRLIPVIISASIAEDSTHGFLGIVLSFHDISHQKQMENALRNSREKYKNLARDYYKLANYDALTGLSNRRLFFQELKRFQTEFNNNKKEFALIFLDVNEFKRINDRYGHDVGDKLLIEVSKRLHKCQGENDILARMGGDEFVLLIVDVNSKKILDRIQQIKAQFINPVVIENIEYTISIAAGFSVYSNEKGNVNNLLRNADQAAKQ